MYVYLRRYNVRVQSTKVLSYIRIRKYESTFESTVRRYESTFVQRTNVIIFVLPEVGSTTYSSYTYNAVREYFRTKVRKYFRTKVRKYFRTFELSTCRAL